MKLYSYNRNPKKETPVWLKALWTIIFTAWMLILASVLVIPEGSRTKSVFAGKNPSLLRENFLKYPHIPSKFSLEEPNFYPANTASHLSADYFLVDLGETGRS